MPRRLRPLADRFWEKVDRNGPIPEYRPDLGNCWLWTKSTNPWGYGQISIGTGREKRPHATHVVAWELENGPRPDGYQVDHLCRVRLCCRPTHLQPVPPPVNKARGMSPNAINKRKTHCKWRHEFTPENTRIRPGGRRACRTCDRDAASRSNAARQERQRV